MEEETTETEKPEEMRTALNSTILAQQTAIEILTNILSGADDSDEEGWDDCESDGGMVRLSFLTDFCFGKRLTVRYSPYRVTMASAKMGAVDQSDTMSPHYDPCPPSSWRPWRAGGWC